ncbi:hypothetical protein [Fundidesulfovibrio soli]|uniref:hypothetical protein n=1 Tax=Fundidesulfovibrio soli TaxID=2922716 RepID=UPI001FAFA2D4|nr:hypothetical protein [Fundidesulfovibrio soli]
MEVPSMSRPQWSDLVTGKKTYQLKFLAAKILLGRLVHSVKENPTPDNIKSCVELVYNVYAKNAGSPSVQEDLTTIFG